MDSYKITKKAEPICLILLLFFVFWFGFKPGWNKTNTDFPNYYVSSKMLLHGNLKDAYNIERFNSEIRLYNPSASGLFVMYPPTTALLMLPFSFLEMPFAKNILLLVTFCFLVHLVLLIQRITALTLLQSALILLFGGFNLANDIVLGQVYIFMLWLLVMGYWYYSRGAFRASGFYWGCVAAIKFLPLLFLPFLLYKKKYMTCASLSVVFLFLHLLTYSLSGKSTYVAFKNSFTTNYLEGKVANQIPKSIQYQSFEAFANNKIEQNSTTSLSAQIWSDSKTAWLLFWSGLSFYLLILFRKHTAFIQIAVCLSILLLLLLEKGSASYHLLFCLVPLLFVLTQTTKSFSFGLVILWLLLGFWPSIAAKIPVDFLLFSYSRLILLSVFSLLFYFSLFQLHHKPAVIK